MGRPIPSDLFDCFGPSFLVQAGWSFGLLGWSLSGPLVCSVVFGAELGDVLQFFFFFVLFFYVEVSFSIISL